MTIYFSGWKHILGFLLFPPKNRSADRDDRKGRKNPTICGGKKRCFSFLFFQHFFRLHHCSTSRTGGGKRKGKKVASRGKKRDLQKKQGKEGENWPRLGNCCVFELATTGVFFTETEAVSGIGSRSEDFQKKRNPKSRTKKTRKSHNKRVFRRRRTLVWDSKKTAVKMTTKSRKREKKSHCDISGTKSEEEKLLFSTVDAT